VKILQKVLGGGYFFDSHCISNTTHENRVAQRAGLSKACGLAMRILSVRPSVRPSVCQTRASWQNGKKDLSRIL